MGASFGGSQADVATAVAVDSGDNVVAVGTQNCDAIVRKYSATGNPLWSQSFGGDNADAVEDVAVDSVDRIFVTGSFRKEVDFDPSAKQAIYTSVGGRDVFAARFSSAGVFDLVRVSGSALDDVGNGIVVNANDNAIYTGLFRETIDVFVGPGNATLTSRGSGDAFLVRQALANGIDDATVHLTSTDLDGFTFQFYGLDYNELFFSSNGLITFGTENPDGNNTDLTDPPSQASIAAFWEDLITGSGDREAVFWEVRGSGDDQRLIIQWNDVRLANPRALGEGPLNFQAVLSERDNSIQFNYAAVTGSLLFDEGTDQRVGTFGVGEQYSPATAADQNGNYVVVWTADGQDGSGLAVYGRMFDADANPLTDEFRVNSTVAGNQAHAKIAMNADGRFVVVWDTDDADVFAQIFDPAGNRVGTEFRVNASLTGTQQLPDVIMDDAGNFVVTWNGSGLDDANGVFARRFDANGAALGTVNEIQRLEILGPPALQPSNFTLQLAGETTGRITLCRTGKFCPHRPQYPECAARLAQHGQPDHGHTDHHRRSPDDHVHRRSHVRDLRTRSCGIRHDTDRFCGTGRRGHHGPEHRGRCCALSPLSDQITVVATDDYEYVVTFLGPIGATDLPLMIVSNPLLDQGAITITETVQGVSAADSLRFEIVFAGSDGSQDQPMLVHVDRLSGVTHLQIEEFVAGNNGEFRINNFIPNAQSNARMSIDDSGNFVVVWQSAEQDGSNLGIFAKRFDAAGVAQPSDQDEQQQISLLGPPVANSTYRLGFDGQVTEVINYTGGNVADAAAIQTALRNLPNLGNSLTVQPAVGTSDEIQRILFTGTPTAGTFVLAHAGLITAPITYAGTTPANGLTTATNIQNALRALPNLSDSVTVVPTVVDSAIDFLVTFAGPDGGIDQPLLFLVLNNLDVGTAAISEFNKGGHSTTDFIVNFLGVDGRHDQPELTLADNTGGVIDMTTTTLLNGADSEFQVNEITLDSQSLPVIATSNTGQFIVVWQSPDQDGTGIYARLFDADGSALTSDFQVNTFTEGNQHNPAVIADAAGNFVISWTSEAQDGDLGGIYARRFDSEGAALSEEFLVNVLTAGNQRDIDIAARADGTFVAAFASEAGFGGIHARRFVQDGTPLDAAEIQTSIYGTASQDSPVVARNATGDFVVVWTEALRDPTIDRGIYAQAFLADGTPRSGELVVPQLTIGTQQMPDVVIDDDGNFTVTWVTVVGTGTSSFEAIHARRFAADGSALSDEFTVSTLTNGSKSTPQIGMDAARNFTVVWAVQGTGIMRRRFDASGTAIDTTELLVNTTSGQMARPSIDVNAAGDFVVVWDRFTASASNVYARRFAADGTPQGSNFLVNESMLSGVSQGSADVALADDDSFVVIWESDGNPAGGNDVLGRRFDSSGNPLGGEFVIASLIADDPMARISSDNGVYVVTWTDNAAGGIVGQRYAADGDLVGSPFVVNDPTGGVQDLSSVSVGPQGAFLVGWLDTSQEGQRVMVERFTVDNPSAGIKAEGTQIPLGNLLPLWVDGSQNPFVGSGMSTKIFIPDRVRQQVFAVDANSNEIHQLDPDTAAILKSIPMPESINSDAGLAFAGNTLYFVSDTGSMLYALAPASGAVVDAILLADLGITESITGLAYLNDQVVLQAAAGNTLYFIDPFHNALTATVTTSVSLVGGLAGAGSRGTLFAVESGGDIVEIDPADGSVINNYAPPFSDGMGLAFVEGYLWVGNAVGQLSKVDPDTGTEVDSWSTTMALSALGGDDGGAIQTAVRGNFRPFVGTVIDDEADLPIAAGEGPFTGRFLPIEPLSLFDDQSVSGTWSLEIQDTATGDTGVLTGWKLIINDPDDVPPDFQYTSNLGGDSPNADNDIDLYRVDVPTAGVITVEVQPGTTLDSVIRVFDVNGNELALANTPGLGAVDSVKVTLPAAGVYLVGISSDANTGYSPLDGSGAADGTSSGMYLLSLSFDRPLNRDDNNSSFVTATNFGVLGQAGQTVFAEIKSPLRTIAIPDLTLEPGHRDTPPEAHYGGGTTDNAINTFLYNFRDNYGTLPNGDSPQNVITENQKQRTREIFEIYGDLLGVKFVETPSQGLIVVTGDLRSPQPQHPDRAWRCGRTRRRRHGHHGRCGGLGHQRVWRRLVPSRHA